MTTHSNPSTYPPPVETPHSNEAYPLQGTSTPAYNPAGYPPGGNQPPQAPQAPWTTDTAYPRGPPPSHGPPGDGDKPPDYESAHGGAGYTGPPQGAPPHAQQPPHQPYPAQGYYPAQGTYPVQQFGQVQTYGQNPAYPTAAAPGYSHGPPPPGVTVVLTQTRASFGPNSMPMKCGKCHADITTTTTNRVGSMAWMAVGIIVLIGCFIFPLVLLGCCFIPLCIPSLKDVEHSCPNCRAILGHYNRSGTL